MINDAAPELSDLHMLVLALLTETIHTITPLRSLVSRPPSTDSLG